MSGDYHERDGLMAIVGNDTHAVVLATHTLAFEAAWS